MTNFNNFQRQAEASVEILREMIKKERAFGDRMVGLGFIRREVGGSIIYAMSQRKRAEQILEKLRLPTDDELRALDLALGDAQNQPPLGEADGSINEQAWYALRDAIEALQKIRPAIETFKRSLS